MELITSSIDSAYKLTFSPGFRETVKKSTATDLLMIVLIAIVIVYILAKLFKGKYNAVCTKICPIKEGMDNNSNHVSNKIKHLSELCTADTLTLTIIDATNSKQTYHLDYVKGQETILKLPRAIKAQKLLHNWDHHGDVKGIKLETGCPIGKVYVHVINLETGKEESVKFSYVKQFHKSHNKSYVEKNSKLFTVTGFHIAK